MKHAAHTVAHGAVTLTAVTFRRLPELLQYIFLLKGPKVVKLQIDSFKKFIGLRHNIQTLFLFKCIMYKNYISLLDLDNLIH